MKQKKMVLINKTLTKKTTTLYQTATLYWSRQEKKSENSFQSMFTIQLSTSGAENSLDEEWFY